MVQRAIYELKSGRYSENMKVTPRFSEQYDLFNCADFQMGTD